MDIEHSRQVGKTRIVVEVEPEDVTFIRQVRAAAVIKGLSLREWVLQSIREKYERENGGVLVNDIA